MNKVVQRIIMAFVIICLAFAIFCTGLIVYEVSLKSKGYDAIIAAENSDMVVNNYNAASYFLLHTQGSPTEVYFLDEPLEVETCFYGGRLYVPFEETYYKLVVMTDNENTEDFGVIYDNFIFSGYSDDPVNPYFLEVEGECWISFYKLVKGMGLAAVFDSENDKVTICYRKMDTSDLPEITKSEDAKPAILRLEDITPDGYCENPRYTDEGLEKLRAMAEYLERREQTFYIAWIMRYVNPEQGIDLDPTKVTNTYTAGFMYTLDYLIDKGGKIILHGYTHQYDDYFSADGFEFGYFSTLTMQERAERLLMARNDAALLSFDNTMWEFPHYGATPSDLVMAEEVYSVIFQSANKVFNADDIIVKTSRSGKTVTYVPLPAYYLNNIYELDDMLQRIDKCEEKGCVAGLFFHPSIDFEKIEADTTPWGVRNWYYTPYWALPTITDKVLSDGYTFCGYEEYLKNEVD